MIKIKKTSCDNTNIAMALISGRHMSLQQRMVAGVAILLPSQTRGETRAIHESFVDSVSPVGTVVRHKGCTATDWECKCTILKLRRRNSRIPRQKRTISLPNHPSTVKAIAHMVPQQDINDATQIASRWRVNVELDVPRATVENSVTEIANLHTDGICVCGRGNHATVCGQRWTVDGRQRGVCCRRIRLLGS
jgi:hypothetical protein